MMQSGLQERQAAAIERWLSVFVRPGQVTELRALNVEGKRAVCHVFGDLARLAARAVELDAAGATGTYFTPNPLRPDLAGSSAGCRKADVTRRHWLLVDVDPGRPAGLSSTDAEREAAWAVLDRCRATLDGAGLTGAVVGDSGNGWHLCYPIDLAADDAAQGLIKAVLAGLQARCGDQLTAEEEAALKEGGTLTPARAAVDRSTHDAPRIWKCYGTRSRKGEPTAERPHRWARLIEGEPWTLATASGNTILLPRVLARWQRIADARRGRPETNQATYAAAALTQECAAVAGTGPGERNNQLNRSAYVLGQLVAAGALGEQEVTAALTAAATQCGLDRDPDCGPAGIARTIASGMSKGREQPRNLSGVGVNGRQTTGGRAARVRALPPFRPFPTEALPSPLRQYVTQTARAIGCDPCYVALPALAAVASAVGNQRVLRLKRSWYEVAVIWSLIVGDSGTLKSPAYKAAVRALFRVQRRLFVEHKAKCKAARQAKEDSPAGPERVVCSDTTIERLAEILEDNPRGILMARDELAGWLGSFTRYRQAGSDLPNWLEMWQAGTIVVDRKTTERKNVVVERAAVSLTGGIQPGVLARALSSDFLDAGLAARLLMAMPPRLPKRWTECEVDPDTNNTYQATLDALLQLGFGRAGDEDRPHVLVLSPEAKARWTAFYDEWAEVQAEAEGEQAAAFSKLEGYAARLALLHHVVTHVGLKTSDLRPVGPRSVEAGITLCRWFAGESRRIYGLLTESDEERDTRRLVEHIRRRGGRITVRQLQHANGRKYPRTEDAQAALDALVRAGLARWLDPDAVQRRGVPSPVLELHPTSDMSDMTTPDGADLASDMASDTSDTGADDPRGTNDPTANPPCTCGKDAEKAGGLMSDMSDVGCGSGGTPDASAAGPHVGQGADAMSDSTEDDDWGVP
jgi:hypothetical protein